MLRQWLAENTAKFTRGVLYEKKVKKLDVSKDNWCCNSLSNIKNEFTIHIFCLTYAFFHLSDEKSIIIVLLRHTKV